MNTVHDWFWEGYIQAKIVEYLRADGWRVTKQADTTSRERGIDVVAQKGSRSLAVEVKGYPADICTRGPRQGMRKQPGQARLQAKIWFAEDLLAAIMILHQEDMQNIEIALAFPDVKRYQELLECSRWALEKLGIGAYLVGETGDVRRILDHVRDKE